MRKADRVQHPPGAPVIRTLLLGLAISLTACGVKPTPGTWELGPIHWISEPCTHEDLPLVPLDDATVAITPSLLGFTLHPVRFWFDDDGGQHPDWSTHTDCDELISGWFCAPSTTSSANLKAPDTRRTLHTTWTPTLTSPTTLRLDVVVEATCDGPACAASDVCTATGYQEGSFKDASLPDGFPASR